MAQHIVTAVRQKVLADLAAALASVDWTAKHWQKIERGQLPRGTVWIPRVATSFYTDEQVQRVPEIRVLLKREGGADIEDVLEADSAAVEAAVLASLAYFAIDFELSETVCMIDGEANKPVGELRMTFGVVLLTPDGAPLI